jgi:hypothetical protein
MMLAWGSLCMAHAGIRNRGTLIALRLLLGAAEAGFVPSVFVSLGLSDIKNDTDFSLSSTSPRGILSIIWAFGLDCLRK